MNRTELIAAVAEKSNSTKKDSEKIVSAFLDTVVETVATGEKVQLIGFGTFEQRIRKERKGVDPRTHKETLIPEKRFPHSSRVSPLRKLLAARVQMTRKNNFVI